MYAVWKSRRCRDTRKMLVTKEGMFQEEASQRYSREASWERVGAGITREVSRSSTSSNQDPRSNGATSAARIYKTCTALVEWDQAQCCDVDPAFNEHQKSLGGDGICRGGPPELHEWFNSESSA